MEEQVASYSPYIAREQFQPLPPPRSEIGIVGTVRRSLFATPLDAALSIAAGIFVLWAGWNILNWAWFDAVFTGSDREACIAEAGGHGGACWAFVKAKFGQFIYGIYPLGERWRVDLVFVLLAVLVAALAIPSVPYKRINAILLFAVFPVVALVLLTGGRFSFSGGEVTLFLLVAAAVTISNVGARPEVGFSPLPIRAAVWLALAALVILLLSNVVTSGRVDLLGLRFTVLTLVAFLATVAALAAALVMAIRSRNGSALGALVPALTVFGFVVVMMADFGLSYVRTSLWGGLMLTLVVALTGIAASLPLGIALALGRRSQMPAVKLVSIIFIEFWRGVPLITVLFMANFMLPLFLPEGVSFNQLLRALVGVALFSAAYMAEVIRGGLQAIPKGQYEGADAMGLTYWQKMRMIILPQALKLVIPGIVNTFIGLFKDTSLVYIIGLADLLGTVRRGFNDPNWITPSTPATGLVFAAFIFWLFCFAMSRYSIYTERRLDTGHKR
jgi:general L-amino acid transport system permease protein